MIYKASGIFRDLWAVNHFVPGWSYKVKSYSGLVAALLAVAYGLQLLELLNFGYLP